MCFSVVSQIFSLCFDKHYVFRTTILCFIAGLFFFFSEFYYYMCMCNVSMFNLEGRGQQDKVSVQQD